MKNLIVLASLLLVATVAQARTVPVDSLEQYLSSANEELFLYVIKVYELERDAESEYDRETADYIGDQISIAALYLVENISTYLVIAQTCGFDDNICSGISFNCKALERIKESIRSHLAVTNYDYAFDEGWAAMTFIHNLLVDIADSVSDKECLKELRERLSLPYYDPSAFGR